MQGLALHFQATLPAPGEVNMRTARAVIHRPFCRAGLIATLSLIATLASSVSAGAATVIGSAAGDVPCSAGMDTVQVASPVSYSVPAGGGTITDWSTFAGPDLGPVALEVWRPSATPGTYTLVDIGPSTPLTANTLNNFHLVSAMNVQANDVLGLRLEGQATCLQYTGVLAEQYGYVVQATPLKGAVAVMRAVPYYRLDVSATVNTAGPLPGGDGHDATGDGQYGLALVR